MGNFYAAVLTLLGALLGMLLTTLVQSEIINRSEKFKAGFKDAFIFYTKTKRGGLYVGGTVVVIAMYLLPSIVNMAWFKYENLRFYSIVLGVGSQAIGFLVVKKTHDKIDEVSNKV